MQQEVEDLFQPLQSELLEEKTENEIMSKEDVERMHARLIRSFTQEHIQTYQKQSRQTSANHSLKALLEIYRQQKQEVCDLQKDASSTEQDQETEESKNENDNIEEVEREVQYQHPSPIKIDSEEKVPLRAVQTNK